VEGQSEDAISWNFLGFSILGSQIEPSICKTFIAGSIPAVASAETLGRSRPALRSGPQLTATLTATGATDAVAPTRVT
jgi:hypothetical protein